MASREGFAWAALFEDYAEAVLGREGYAYGLGGSMWRFRPWPIFWTSPPSWTGMRPIYGQLWNGRDCCIRARESHSGICTEVLSDKQRIVCPSWGARPRLWQHHKHDPCGLRLELQRNILGSGLH